MSTLVGMDLADLPARLKRAGRNQAQLSRYLSLDPSSLTKTIKGDRQLSATELLRIDAFFAASDEELGQDILGRRHRPAGQGAEVESLATRRNGAPRRIPVYGYAAAGAAEAIVFNTGMVTDWIDPPPLWNGQGDLIAIRVIGESMEPRLFAGEYVIAQLGLPPSRGGDCVVELNDGNALVKTYKGQRDATVFLQQYNPDKELKLQGSTVKAIHAVIWRR